MPFTLSESDLRACIEELKEFMKKAGTPGRFLKEHLAKLDSIEKDLFKDPDELRSYVCQIFKDRVMNAWINYDDVLPEEIHGNNTLGELMSTEIVKTLREIIDKQRKHLFDRIAIPRKDEGIILSHEADEIMSAYDHASVELLSVFEDYNEKKEFILGNLVESYVLGAAVSALIEITADRVKEPTSDERK